MQGAEKGEIEILRLEVFALKANTRPPQHWVDWFGFLFRSFRAGGVPGH